MKSLMIVFAAAAFDCGGSASVTGTVGGASLGSVADSEAVVSTFECDSAAPRSNFVLVTLSSTAGLCGDLASAKNSPNTTSLQLLISAFWIYSLPPGSIAPSAQPPAFELNKPYAINNNLDTARGMGVASAWWRRQASTQPT